MNPLIIIPTYNERENVVLIAEKLLGLGLTLDILFVDDASPDGTGEVLDSLAKINPSVRVVHRHSKAGIGSAHLAGLSWARSNGYCLAITMDCDMTHSPEDVPKFLMAAESSDVVVGSRYLRRDSLSGWNWRRKLLTHIAHLLTRIFLAIPYDATGAFRAYRLDRLPAGIFDMVRSKTYPFFFESLFILHTNGISICQIPIHLPPRTYGSSKMPSSEPLRGVKHLLNLAIMRMICHEAFLHSDRSVEVDSDLQDVQGWDSYWDDEGTKSSPLYATIATIYRKAVIARRLNAQIRRNFPPKSRLLHAGCGSGQVDVCFQNEMEIFAVDSSLKALTRYTRTVPEAKCVRHASILALPFPAASFDGIYNLGVMEHFSRDQILTILREFRRVLKPGGRILLFWPHTRATSVAVLSCWRALRSMNPRTTVPLHPPEISLIRSKKWIHDLLREAGFTLESYEFNWRDFWVQAVITARAATLRPERS